MYVCDGVFSRLIKYSQYKAFPKKYAFISGITHLITTFTPYTQLYTRAYCVPASLHFREMSCIISQLSIFLCLFFQVMSDCVPSPSSDSSYASSSASKSSSGSSASPTCEISLLERLIRTHPIWFLPSLQRSGALHLLQVRKVLPYRCTP